AARAARAGRDAAQAAAQDAADTREQAAAAGQEDAAQRDQAAARRKGGAGVGGLAPIFSPPPCGEGLGVAAGCAAGGRGSLRRWWSGPPPLTPPRKGEGDARGGAP